MRVAVFDTHAYDRSALMAANKGLHEFVFVDTRLSIETVELAKGCRGVSCFVNDQLGNLVLTRLFALGVRIIALRCAGFSNIDLKAADALGLTVVRVPEYSPHAVAEHAVALLLTLVRKTHKAFNRVHESNFTLDGLVGFDIAGKTIGVVGTGRIGKVFARILRGFDANVLAYDTQPDAAWATENGIRYVPWEELLALSDVISLHVPLNDRTWHLVTSGSFDKMKKGVILINTGRGALVETKALISALKTKKIGGACLDVYEEEEGVFFSDLSEKGVDDDALARLTTFPNVLITSHQAFLTREALANIAETTISSLSAFESNRELGAVKLTRTHRKETTQ